MHNLSNHLPFKRDYQRRTNIILLQYILKHISRVVPSQTRLEPSEYMTSGGFRVTSELVTDKKHDSFTNNFYIPDNLKPIFI